jgi:chitin disaccharide deacetylase
MSHRFAIVNADDFGLSRGVNRGIAEAHEQGILTNASLMVRWPAAGDAAGYARNHTALGVGLHLDLGEWTVRDGEWAPLYEVVDISDSKAIIKEVMLQLEAFDRLLNKPPTQIDSHQHVHLCEPVRSIVCEVAERQAIPVRDVSIPYCGRFYGQDQHGVSHPKWIGVTALIKILQGLSANVTEIGCHPAAMDDLDTMYRTERIVELRALCDPRVRKAIDEFGIHLISFANWKSLMGKTVT